MDSGIEVTIQVAVARDGVVMEEATVQLDEEPELSVADIAVDGSSIGCIDQLPLRPRKTVRAFDVDQVAVLEDRARAVGQVTQHAGQPRPVAEPAPFRQDTEDPSRRRTARLTHIGQDADRPQTTGLVRRNIDGRMLDANPWRTRVPVDPPVQIGAAAYPITGHISQRALDGNGDLDPRLVGVTPARTDRGAQRRVS